MPEDYCFRLFGNKVELKYFEDSERPPVWVIFLDGRDTGLKFKTDFIHHDEVYLEETARHLLEEKYDFV